MFSVQAHVFQIDPQTKKRWLPSSTNAVRVSYYHDPGRKTFRIISIENSKVRDGCELAPSESSCWQLDYSETGELTGPEYQT